MPFSSQPFPRPHSNPTTKSPPPHLLLVVTIMFLNESEMSLAVGDGGTYLSRTTVDSPLAIRSCIIFNNSGGSESSVALMVSRTICDTCR